QAEEWRPAVEALTMALKLTASDSIAGLMLAMAHWRLGERGEARRCYQRALEGLKNDPQRNGSDLRRLQSPAAALLGIKAGSGVKCPGQRRLRACKHFGTDPLPRAQEAERSAVTTRGSVPEVLARTPSLPGPRERRWQEKGPTFLQFVSYTSGPTRAPP